MSQEFAVPGRMIWQEVRGKSQQPSASSAHREATPLFVSRRLPTLVELGEQRSRPRPLAVFSPRTPGSFSLRHVEMMGSLHAPLAVVSSASAGASGAGGPGPVMLVHWPLGELVSRRTTAPERSLAPRI